MKKRGLLTGLLLVLPVCFQYAYADDEAAAPEQGSDSARQALTQKEGDASSEKNLAQVFQAAEKSYSLLKAGDTSLLFDVGYSYFRDNRIDIALSDGSVISRFRILEEAQHSVTSTLDVSYGVRNNLTFNASLPLVAKFDTQKDSQTTGLGDIGFGVRWQPIPLKRGLPTTTLFANLSTATGDSPYKINNGGKDLSTGKGYYSISAGASVNKVADPIVLFASGSISTSTKVSGLDQNVGGRKLTAVDPGDSLGFSMGLAYALNYDVSITASYQQSFGFSTKYTFQQGATTITSNSAAQMSSMLNFSLGLRTNPKRIVNLSMGFGLTEDSSDVVLGFSMPLDFMISDE